LAQVIPPEKPQVRRSGRVELALVCPFVKVEWPGCLEPLGSRQPPVMPRLLGDRSRRALGAEHSLDSRFSFSPSPALH